MFKKAGLLAVGALALGLGINSASMAADWPKRPITMVVPYKAGGTTETMGQVLSKALGRELGTKVIVKTKPGGGSAVGTLFAKNQKADGYTILFVPLGQFLWNPMDRPEVNYHHSDFRILAGISEYQIGIISTPDKPYKTLEELVAYTKKNPGLNVADMGGMSKAFINFIAAQNGVDWTPIPTRGGGEMIPFLLGGKVDFAFSGGVHQKYGDKMIVLASFMKDRLPLAPNAPSTHELYGIAMPGNAIMVAPKGIPDDIAAKLEAGLKASMNDADFTKILQKIQFPKKFIPSAELKPFLLESEKGIKKVLDAIRAG